MRIAFITFFKPGYGGGVGQIAHEIAHYFSRYHDVALIYPADKQGYHQEGRLQVFGLPSAGEGDLSIPVVTAATLHRLFNFLDDFKPDVIHAHEPTPLDLFGQIWARLHTVPFVHTAHVLPSKVLDFGGGEAIRLMRTALAQSITQDFLQEFYGNCDAIIALNDAAEQDLRTFGYKGRIFKIPNGRDLERYNACHLADPTEPEKLLTFIGYISQRKNQAYLLDVLAHLPPAYKLQLIGDFLNPRDERDIREKIAALGLEERVLLVGRQPHERIPAYLERTHVFVSASKMEVQSLVIIEALASGTPVVGLSNETIDELVNDEVGKWLPKDTPPEVFAQHVEAIATLTPEAYHALCLRARQRVQHLDWSNVMAQTIAAYQILIREQKNVTHQQHNTLRRAIRLMPRGELRGTLWHYLMRVEKLLPQAAPVQKLQAARRVRNRSWMFMVLALPASWIGSLLLGLLKLSQRARKAPKSGQA